MADLDDEVDRTRKELQLTIRSIAETKATLKNEHIFHRDEVEELKHTIKEAKADILAIQSGTFPSAVEARTSLAERQSAEMLDMESKRVAIKSEIDSLKQRLENDAKIHTYKMEELESEIKDLHQEKADVLNKNTTEMEETELELQKLTDDYSKNKVVLDKLEQRLKAEKEKQNQLEQRETTRLEEEANAQALEEKKHYAALWIQLRWKRFKKRQLLKPKGKGKKGKGGKKKKKKK
eukprot:CAMPEP_0201718002 /NCGR_PEP_ID=MMETSP0593-20130828/3607_1 /ASSEMBLY_ACC=CAM_ASM_000672 /TAXON_ID=267983 /ORGANISM="Skeletonema japonicum, Strain CCMP2506" /LENGTH=235 /DNA_ID=CAMNT_0048208181 /DNA_START=48 /DNA_END=755 /DNA_ORIENTATION=+